MIEINLLPGSTRKQKRRSAGLSAGPLWKLTLPKIDKVLGAAIAMWVVGVLLIFWMHTSSSARLEELTIEEEALAADTTRVAALLAQNTTLMGKRDTVVAKLNIIQELDAGRFNWAHILDEVSRAVPDYTWLVSVTPGESMGSPTFRIEGRMANAFALPRFMKALEASPFIANVMVRSSAPVTVDGKSFYSFNVDGTYEEPPLDLITTVPLFAQETIGTDMPTDAAAADSSAVDPAGGE